MKAKILLIDDKPVNILLLKEVFTRDQSGYEIDETTSTHEALDLLNHKDYDVVITDLMMPELSGIDILKAINNLNKVINVIIVTAVGGIEDAISATREGAYDFIRKPFDPKELILKVRRAVESVRMKKELRELKRQVPEDKDQETIITCNPALIKVIEKSRAVAQTDATVLITGESGTGKELFAKYLHKHSNRRDKPFVIVNCSAIPGTLLESELFGHEKGAYTGASIARKGLFLKANTGTIFLDEIGDIDSQIQVKLLRTLQDGEIRAVGSDNSINIDVRIISATNQDLKARVQEGKFREDLFFRLNVIPIHLPPLRDRKEDIILIANHFLREYCVRYNKIIKGFTQEALDYMRGYFWHGNIRELKNNVEHAVVIADTEFIEVKDLILDSISVNKNNEPSFIPGSKPIDFKQAKENFEKNYFINLLKSFHGNVSKAAEISGISRKNIYDYIKKLDIDVEAIRK